LLRYPALRRSRYVNGTRHTDERVHMPNLVALIDANFGEMIAYYRTFSCDETWTGHIEIQPRDVQPIHLTSFEALLTQIRDQLRRGRREILVGMHGYRDALPYPIIAGTSISPDVEFMNLLRGAAGGSAADKDRDKMLEWQDNKGKKLFANGERADRLIEVVRQIRGMRIDHLEIRGCNIGAGGALKAVHLCLNSVHTAAPNTTFFSGMIRTAGIREIQQAVLAQQISQLVVPRTYSRSDCLLAASSQSSSDDTALGFQLTEVSRHPHRFHAELRASSQQAVLGWTRTVFENSYYYPAGSRPPGGGYRPGAHLPIIGMWTPNGRQPFLFPGDGFDYLNVLQVENTP
jgi:hypothetical protein